MKIDTKEPRLPIKRLKHPLKSEVKSNSDEPDDLLFGNKLGEELARVARRLYEGAKKKQM